MKKGIMRYSVVAVTVLAAAMIAGCAAPGTGKVKMVRESVDCSKKGQRFSDPWRISIRGMPLFMCTNGAQDNGRYRR